MTDFLFNALIMVAAILPFVFLCFVNEKANIERAGRSKQFFMPVIALVYVGVIMAVSTFAENWLIRFINAVPWAIAKVADLPFVPRWGVGSVFMQIGAFLLRITKSIDLEAWIVFITDTAAIGLYLLIKKLCTYLMAKFVKTDGRLHSAAASIFYEFFPERNSWCLIENNVQARGFLKIFYFAAIVISVLMMFVSRQLHIDGMPMSVFHPVLGVLIVGELYFYLGGTTKREYITFLGEDENSFKTVNYSLLRKFLRSLFGDKLLAESTDVSSSFLPPATNDEIIRELELSEDPKVISFASYIRSLNSAGFELDHNYINSSLDLLNEKSVLFNDPFYYDLIPYAFYPMNRQLLRHRKVLVIPGRHAVEDDIRKWLEKGIEAVTNIPSMWNIDILGSGKNEPDIAILPRRDIPKNGLCSDNAPFFSKVGFIVMIEPSKLISTAQTGLNLIVKQCMKNAVYCMCDKNCDGLVDAMSHILMTDLSEVSAIRRHSGTSSYMCWEADGDYLHHRLIPGVSRYLGLGTELSFAALKNQVSDTGWYGGDAFPVTDISWINKQYYYDLMKYAGLPASQESMDEHFHVTPDFWSAEVKKDNYLTVEDESFNMFEILREFSTRSTEQGFINIISSNYLLKDYMADNAQVFEADPKAIPFIVPDYAKTNRNTALKLILMMSTAPVSESTIEKELSLLGIKVFDIKKQLWYEIFSCCASLSEYSALSGNYRYDVETAAEIKMTISGESYGISLINTEKNFDLKQGKAEYVYSIRSKSFTENCVSGLFSAGYVAEDENDGTSYLGSELVGHIYQKYLPGQYFTFGGKYYEMQYLTADGNVLIRRASDHIDGRPSYRQLRKYTVSGTRPFGRIGTGKSISGIKVIKEYADITVSTYGYYRMISYNDFSTARKILFEGDESSIPDRFYRGKEILRIQLPEADGKLSDTVRYTVTVLLNEVFRTLFAENQPYICAVTDDSFITEEVTAKPLTYKIKADKCIYIIEDSQLDLGLIIAVERNLERILGIIQDYLCWHAESLKNSDTKSSAPALPIAFADDAEEIKSSDGFFGKVRGFFGRKRGKNPFETPPPDVVAQVLTGRLSADSIKDPNAVTYKITDEIPQGAAPAQNSDRPAAPAPRNGEIFLRRPYSKRCYTLFGFESEPSCMDTAAALDYLTALGFDKNPLKKARESRSMAKMTESMFRPDRAGSRYCDFCGTEIYGVEYETLLDGRDRCLSCSRTAIKSAAEFRKVFEDVKRNMEAFFGIKINVGIRVEAVSAKAMQQRLGQRFVPSPQRDGRALGIAVRDKNGYSLYMENGAPRMSTMLTMAHELTHIWQYIYWNDHDIKQRYGQSMSFEVYEGMAKWAEIQYAYLINEPAVAKREEIYASCRNDEYGYGFLRYRANYPFSTGTVLTNPTPFMNTVLPLDPAFCGTMTMIGLSHSKKPLSPVNHQEEFEAQNDDDVVKPS